MLRVHNRRPRWRGTHRGGGDGADVSCRSMDEPLRARAWPASQGLRRRYRASRPPPRECVVSGAFALAADSLRRLIAERLRQLPPGGKVQLPEDLVEVVFDGGCGDEQPGGNLGIGRAASGQPSDLRLLSGQAVPGLLRSLAGM